MNTIHSKERGQVLIIFVFAIIGLIGITGLAIDGSNIYSDRRHAQNAADTAALAGALTRVKAEKAVLGANTADCQNLAAYGTCAADVINTALDRATSNGYTNLVDGTVVEIHTPPMDGYYKDCTSPCDPKNYVQVIIKTNVNTFFARVLGIPQMHNTVEAVALADYKPKTSLYGGNSLVELRPHSGTCGGDFSLGGSGTVTLTGGGIFVNSDNDTCAFKQVSCSVTLTLGGSPAATLQGIGGVSSGVKCSAPPMAHATTPYPFPPSPPLLASAPAECGQPAQPSSKKGSVTTYQPGYYHSLPTGSNIKLAAGVYCVDDLNTTNSDNIDGSGGVFIYIKPNGSFQFNGGTVKLNAPSSGTYRNYLIYVDSTFTGTPPNCKINGSAGDTFTGLIYAPYCDVEVSGSSSPTGITAQIIGYTISLNGTNTLNFTFDADKVPQIPEVNNTGLYH